MKNLETMAAERSLSPLICWKTPLLDLKPDAGTQTATHGTVSGNKRCKSQFSFPSLGAHEDSGCCWGLLSSTSVYLCHVLAGNATNPRCDGSHPTPCLKQPLWGSAPPAPFCDFPVRRSQFLGYGTAAANDLQADLEAAHLYPGAVWPASQRQAPPCTKDKDVLSRGPFVST